MVHFYAVSLFATLLVKNQNALDRLGIAIDLCRTYAAMPLQPMLNGFSGKGIAAKAHERIYELYMVGLVFVHYQQWVFPAVMGPDDRWNMIGFVREFPRQM